MMCKSASSRPAKPIGSEKLQRWQRNASERHLQLVGLPGIHEVWSEAKLFLAGG